MVAEAVEWPFSTDRDHTAAFRTSSYSGSCLVHILIGNSEPRFMSSQRCPHLPYISHFCIHSPDLNSPLPSTDTLQRLDPSQHRILPPLATYSTLATIPVRRVL